MTPALALAAALAVAAAPSHKAAPVRPTHPPPAAAPAVPDAPSTIYRIQQIAVGQPMTPELAKQLEPLHTLDDVEALLKANKITFSWRDLDVSSTRISEQMQQQIAKLPPHEPFIAAGPRGWTVSVIVDQHPATAASPSPSAP